MERELIVDAGGQVLGRVSSEVAKLLLDGAKVTVINAENTVVTGRPAKIVEEFRARRARGDPHHGPYYPAQPAAILKRSVRGMLPYKKETGRSAFARLRVYGTNPENKSGKRVSKESSQLTCQYITLHDISRALRGG